MSIEKNTKNTLVHECGGFTELLNETIQHVHNADALGIYVYLTSLPKNSHASKAQLQNHFKTGRSSIDTSLSKLKKIGLIEIKGKSEFSAKHISLLSERIILL